MKLTAVFPVHNQHALADASIECALHTAAYPQELELLVIDNGSTPPFENRVKDVPTIVHRLDKNIGVYPTFWEGLRIASGDILAFFHSDLLLTEHGWDKRLIAAFEEEPELGLVGFIGSNEIDARGGRGLGTCSNFQGGRLTHVDHNGTTNEWTGSPAEAHGRRVTGVEYAAVVDGCAMVFRRSVLEEIPQRVDFPIHHFYDRLLSCEVRERGYRVLTMGIGCDHISGQTANQEPGYDDAAREWAQAHGLTMEGAHNWDTVVYREAERQFLSEYRDRKHLIPFKV